MARRSGSRNGKEREREKGEEVSVEIGAGSASWANFFLADRRGRAHPPAWR